MLSCTKCKNHPRRISKTGKEHSWCRECLAQDTRRRRLLSPEKMKEQRLQSYKKRYAIVRARIDELKRAACRDCDNTYPPYVMEFDHREPKQKIKAVSTLSRNTVSWDWVVAEIKKCDLVCSNCHAIRTHLRRTGQWK